MQRRCPQRDCASNPNRQVHRITSLLDVNNRVGPHWPETAEPVVTADGYRRPAGGGAPRAATPGHSCNSVTAASTQLTPLQSTWLGRQPAVRLVGCKPSRSQAGAPCTGATQSTHPDARVLSQPSWTGHPEHATLQLLQLAVRACNAGLSAAWLGREGGSRARRGGPKHPRAAAAATGAGLRLAGATRFQTHSAGSLAPTC